jgi:oxygen-independent coproporphyrinogen-3 oxidase
MAGIYVHVPFCGHACTYCDFYFTTHLQFKEQFLQALIRETKERREYLKEPISTLYFGGGTPSRLQVQEIELILQELAINFDLNSLREFTLEANPDDIRPEYLSDLVKLGVNRLSLGIQSFHDEDLLLMGRQHSATESIRAVSTIRKAGIDNFNLDLIYGIPNSTSIKLKENIERLIELNPNHISSYCLTVEPGTQLDYQVKKGRVIMPDEEDIEEQFDLIIETLQSAGYLHYEISNWSKPGKESLHNTSYWKGTHYLGLGPSAHSYNGHSRSINVASTPLYVKGIEMGKPKFETENLNQKDKFNEYIMTRLRTHWGVDLDSVSQNFGVKMAENLLKLSVTYIAQGFIEKNEQSLTLTRQGMLLSDKIVGDLFWVD